MVSVPCRGTTFLNFHQKPSDNNLCPTSFRPLSGNYISQLRRSFIMANTTMFPSPVGELHFSIGVYFFQLVDCSFRPLSGNYISQ